MKKSIVLLFALSSSIITMQPPLPKRFLPEEDQSLPASQAEKRERKDIQSKKLEFNNELAGATQQIGIANLPLELQEQLAIAVLDAKGPTQLARLYNAAENIRNFAAINKDYNAWLTHPKIVDLIIKKLAHLYTHDDDFVAVVAALGTDQASQWVGNRVNQVSVVVPENQFVVINDDSRKFIDRFSNYISDALFRAQADIFIMLLRYVDLEKKAAFVNDLGVNDIPVLVFAIRNKLYPIIADLLSLPGINPNVKDLNDITPLHEAIEQQDLLLVQRLLQFPNIQINAPSQANDTPLLIAVRKKNKPLVDLLLARGAHINVLNSLGESPLIIAVKNKDYVMVQQFLGILNIDPNLQAGPPAFERVYPTALEIAVRLQDLRLVELLLAHARTDVNSPEGETGPLHLAASNGNLDITRMLIAAEAFVNAPADNGVTPLILAAANGHAAVVRELLANGAHVNVRDNENHSALSRAREAHAQDIIAMLIQAGATEGVEHEV